MKTPKPKICSIEGCENEFTPFKTTDKYCSWDCAKLESKPKKRKRIKPVSIKQEDLNRRYSKKRSQFMQGLIQNNKIDCPIFNHLVITDVHHMKGRKGYADEWAIKNDIPLILDVRFWIGVSRQGHNKIENNPEWARENGYSLNRL